MAKERTDTERAERKDKKRKEKHERATVQDNGVKKSKKEKKKVKDLAKTANGASANANREVGQPESPVKGDVPIVEAVGSDVPHTQIASNMDLHNGRVKKAEIILELAKEDLVPFANPLAEDKVSRRLLRGVTQGAKQGTLKRGVKEGVKFARKTQETGAPSSRDSHLPFAIALIAADVSPADVISHLPVLCEDYNVPYIFIRSRRELGQAAVTKRPTSIIFVTKDKTTNQKSDSKRKIETKSDNEPSETWDKTYESMVRMVRQAGESIMI